MSLTHGSVATTAGEFWSGHLLHDLSLAEDGGALLHENLHPLVVFHGRLSSGLVMIQPQKLQVHLFYSIESLSNGRVTLSIGRDSLDRPSCLPVLTIAFLAT